MSLARLFTLTPVAATIEVNSIMTTELAGEKSSQERNSQVLYSMYTDTTRNKRLTKALADLLALIGYRQQVFLSYFLVYHGFDLVLDQFQVLFGGIRMRATMNIMRSGGKIMLATVLDQDKVVQYSVYRYSTAKAIIIFVMNSDMTLRKLCF